MDSSSSGGARYFLATLNILVAVVGVSGNVFVIYASKVHSALKIDRVSVIYLESLASSDIIMSICVYLTTGVTLLAERWVLGDGLCYFAKVATMSSTYNETLTIAVLSIYRVWMLRKPPTARRDINMRWVYGSVAVLHSVGVGVVAIVFAAFPQFMVHPSEDNCSFVDTFTMRIKDTTVHKGLTLVPTLAFVVVPMFITVTTTAFIFKVFLGYDHKMGRKHERAFRVIKLLLFVCITFVLSYTALIVSSLHNTFIGPSPPPLRASVHYFVAINVISNPFIYVVISPHFRGYLRQCSKRVKTVIAKRRPPVESENHMVDSERHSTFRKSDDIVTNNRSSL